MTDTQWRRYQVFLQEKEGQPHLDVGSVHAPDPELALLNARDVFVRRPECSSLWVVPAEVIYSQTAMESGRIQPSGSASGHSPGGAELSRGAVEKGHIETYYVFCKPRPAGTQTLVGKVDAGSPQEAINVEIGRFKGKPAPSVWWAFPARAVVESDSREAGSLFAPALDKPFRLSTDFKTVSAMRAIRGTADDRPRTTDRRRPLEDG